MKLNFSAKFILLGILLIASAFRFYGINWDQGFHLHPDERAIVMTVVNLQYPQSISNFITPESTWNPNFFAYGSFPFYLLKIFGDFLSILDPNFSGYGLIQIAGRILSAFFDIATVTIIFRFGRKLFGEAVGFLSALFYALSVLPIQLSHFYAVDTILTFFIITALYQLVLFYEKPAIKRALLIGSLTAMAIATKVSAVLLIFPILFVLCANYLFILVKHYKSRHYLAEHLPAFVKHFYKYTIIIAISGIVTFLLVSPYAFIDFAEFWRQTNEQSQMTRSAFTFPYTLQYVGKIPYLYELQNIFLWGLGPVIAILSLAGFIYFINKTLSEKNHKHLVNSLAILIFFLVYFWVVGKFAIGFMRYMLPAYPILCLFAGLFAYKLLLLFAEKVKNPTALYTLYFIIATLIFIWPLSFVQIYTEPNTRTTASVWMNKYIPTGSVIAQEHWDDAVPLYGGEKYHFVSLPLYDPDTDEKWQNLNNLLALTDYIVLASNRLYTPLQKLTNCQELPQDRCYIRTAKYYESLFNGTLGFQKIAEFTSYPTIPILSLKINDQSADESFTVYDHPKIMIFQKINPIVNKQ